MQENIFSILRTEFLVNVMPQENETDFEIVSGRVAQYLKTFPHQKIKEDNSVVPTWFQRYWIIVCINSHLYKTKQLRRLLKKKKTTVDSLKRTSLSAQLWLGHAERLYEASQFLLTHFNNKPLSQYILSPEDLKLGDVILSYKTSSYLKHSPLSLFIKHTTHSSITHAMVVCNEPSTKPELLMSDDTTNGLGTLDVITDEGEIFLVLEPLPHQGLDQVYSEIRQLRSVSEEKRHSRSLQRLYQFAKLKCEVACVIGFAYICAGALFKYPLSVRNPAEKQAGSFCSEFIDTLFKNAGISLTPRSEYAAIVGPVEFLYSPVLRIKGIIGDKETIASTEFEVEKEFGVIEKFHPNHHANV